MFRRSLIVCLVVLTFGMFAASTQAAKKKGPITEAGGKVTAIDVSGGKITLAGKKDKNGNEKPATEFKFDKATVTVTKGKDAAKIEDVTVGAVVQLKLAEDSRTVKSINLGGKGKDETKKKKNK